MWLIAGVLACGALVARAGEPSARSLVSQANQAMTDGDNAKALELLQKAEELKPDSPEIAYDLGVVHYRVGDYEAAADSFMKALAGRNLDLEQRSRFNLGNCAYAEGLKKQEDPKAAIDKFKAAADRFRAALELDPRDADARANLERSGLMVQQMKELQKQQEQQQQQKQDKQDQSTSQPESQPSSQPENRPESQPSSQPENQQQQQKADQKEGDKQEGKPQAANQQEGEQEKKEAQQAQAEQAEQKTMSKEEAERLLQLIRDKEQQRREAQYNEDQKGHTRDVPVDKDW